jgi:hypothetical protein
MYISRLIDSLSEYRPQYPELDTNTAPCCIDSAVLQCSDVLVLPNNTGPSLPGSLFTIMDRMVHNRDDRTLSLELVHMFVTPGV